jgi:hypothetical protein
LSTEKRSHEAWQSLGIVFHLPGQELVRQRYELPDFRTLDRLVQRVRTLVHARLFHLVLGRLSDDDQQLLDGLLRAEPTQRSMFDTLKQPPPRPSLPHRDELVSHLGWLDETVSRLNRSVLPAAAVLLDKSKARKN